MSPSAVQAVDNNRQLAAEAELRRRLKRRQAAALCCRRTVAFVFSYVGLAAIVVAYSIVGGLIFRELEAPHEAEQRKKFGRLKHAHVDSVQRLVTEIFDPPEARPQWPSDKWRRNFTARTLEIFVKFQEEVVDISSACR